MKIRVVNKKTHSAEWWDGYVGRGSPLGNPYTHLNYGKGEFRVATREEAIRLYKGYLKDKINEGDPRVIRALNELVILGRKYSRLNLVCFCSPASCHADFIKETILNKLNENNKT